MKNIFHIFILLHVIIHSYDIKEYFPNKINPQPIQPIDKNTCICDLTFNLCDKFCCCDQNCNQNEINAFDNQCKIETLYNRTDQSCQSINSTLLLCKQYEISFLFQNTEYYSDKPDVITNDQFIKLSNKEKTEKKFLSNYLEKGEEEEEEEETILFYKYLSPIVIKDLDNNRNGYLKIPIKTSTSNKCFGEKVLLFGEFYMKDFSCLRILNYQNFENQCNNELNPKKFNSLKYFKNPLDQNYESVTVLNDVSVDIYNESFYINTEQSNGEKVCLNSIKMVKINVLYSSKTIVGIKIGYILQDVKMYNNSANKYTSFEQNFEVKFVNYEKYQNVSIFIKKKSGNPGYLVSSMIRSGREVSKEIDAETTKYAIIEKVNGMEVYTGLNCKDGKTKSIMFKENLITTCRLQFTLDELKSFCKDTISSYVNNTIQFDHIGKFGNSDVRYVNEWTNIIEVPIKTTPSFSADKCSNVLAIVNYEIFYAKTGNILHPNWKIFSVRRSYETKDFRHYNSTLTEDFFLEWRVVFYRNPSETFSRHSIGTGIHLPPLNDDVLYPFN